MTDYGKVHRALNEIQDLAGQIEAVPNLPQDIGTMRRIDRNAKRIRQLSHWIASEIGTGPGSS